MKLKLSDFGFTEGINEIIAITFNEDGTLNTAPIGVIVEDADGIMARARLYKSHTRSNTARTGVFYANVTRDAVVFALASFIDLGEEFFESLNPPVIKGSLAWCRFEANVSGAYATLKLAEGEVLGSELRAVNRGLNAVIEALVHATRYVITKDERKREELRRRILYYYEIVQKCGSEREKRAFEIIMEKI